jgi:putative NADPH-quinone reductase
MSEPKTSRRVLIQFAHPALERSRINRRVSEQIGSIPGVTLNDLYQRYPDFLIDVEREQNLLREHDIVVFQFPLYWYGTPSILKEWQDLVLEYGFAYGGSASALADKVFFCAVSTAGSDASYTREGCNHATLRELLLPLEQTALLCGMRYLPPLTLHNSRRAECDGAISRFIDRYRRTLEYLMAPGADLSVLHDLDELNHGKHLATS